MELDALACGFAGLGRVGCGHAALDALRTLEPWLCDKCPPTLCPPLVLQVSHMQQQQQQRAAHTLAAAHGLTVSWALVVPGAAAPHLLKWRLLEWLASSLRGTSSLQPNSPPPPLLAPNLGAPPAALAAHILHQRRNHAVQRHPPALQTQGSTGWFLWPAGGDFCQPAAARCCGCCASPQARLRANMPPHRALVEHVWCKATQVVLAPSNSHLTAGTFPSWWFCRHHTGPAVVVAVAWKCSDA